MKEQREIIIFINDIQQLLHSEHLLYTTSSKSAKVYCDICIVDCCSFVVVAAAAACYISLRETFISAQSLCVPPFPLTGFIHLKLEFFFFKT